MERFAWIGLPLVLLTAPPAAQAGRVTHALEEAVKNEEAAAHGVKIENKVGGLEAHGASAEANLVKVENGEVGGGSATAPGGADNDAPPGWFYVLCLVGVGAWLFSKFHGKRA